MLALLNAEIALNPNFQNNSIFVLNKLSMHHSVSFMSGYSTSQNGFYQSLYTNHLDYDFSEKLKLRLDLNFVNYGQFQNNLSFSENNSQTKILPNLSLDYQPNENLRISFEIKQYNQFGF